MLPTPATLRLLCVLLLILASGCDWSVTAPATLQASDTTGIRRRERTLTVAPHVVRIDGAQ